MRNKIFALLLSLALIASLLPAAALATEEPDSGEANAIAVIAATDDEAEVPAETEEIAEPETPAEVEEAAEAEEPEASGEPAEDAVDADESAPAEDGAAGVAVSAASFPDPVFLSYVSSNIDTNGDGTLSEAEIAAVTNIWLPWDRSLTDLTGIAYFTELTTLSCYGTGLTSLDVSKNTKLTSLACDNNALTSLDISGCAALETLVCANNPLTSLDLSGCPALRRLNCASCRLTSLDLTHNPRLYSLDIHASRYPKAVSPNTFQTLDLSGCHDLVYLRCSGVGLTALDLSGCTALAELYCSDNALTELDVSACPALEYLDCSVNELTKLTLGSCPALKTLYCYQNQLAALDASGCPALERLECYTNSGLTALDVSNRTALSYLNTADCALTSLNVTGCTALKDLNCLKNALTALDLTDCPILAETVTNGQQESYSDYYTTGTRYYLPGGSDPGGSIAALTADTGVSFTTGAGTANQLPIDAAHFPDAAFRKYIADSFDRDGDGQLSDAELALITEIRLYTYDPETKNQISVNASDLTGIEYLPALRLLDCGDHAIASLDVSGCAALRELYCSNCGLTSLNVTGCAALENLSCNGNALTALDLMGCGSLRTLSVYGNSLTELDLTPCPVLVAVVNEPEYHNTYDYGPEGMVEVYALAARPTFESETGDPDQVYLGFTPGLKLLTGASAPDPRDINGDGKTDGHDAALILQALTGRGTATTLTLIDVVNILRSLAK